MQHPLIDIHHLSTAVILLDHKLDVSFINDAGEQLLGISKRQLIDKPLLHFIAGDLNTDLLRQMLAQEQSGFIQEAEILVKVGEKVTVSLMFTPTQLLEPEAEAGLLLELQTSSHHQNIRQDLVLQQQSRVGTHLVRNLAHEIKNPLGGIKGAAQLLLKKQPESERYCQIIVQEAERLSQLVNRMLLPAVPEPKKLLNPHLVIENALQVIELQLPNWITICRDYDPSIPEIDLAQSQVQQALLNLMKNAMEALAENQPNQPPSIRVKSRIRHQQAIGKRQHKQVLTIEVIDNGPGIPEDIEKDIFFPTISGKDSSGLGLSIAQSLVQQHQGLIELASKPGRTCFRVLLPMESPL